MEVEGVQASAALPGHDIDRISLLLPLEELTVSEDGELIVELGFR